MDDEIEAPLDDLEVLAEDEADGSLGDGATGVCGKSITNNGSASNYCG